MKKLLFSAIASVMALAGCGTSGQLPIPLLTPTQIVAQVCPSAQAVGLALSAMPEIDLKLSAAVQAAQPAVSVLCSEGASISVASLQAFNASALPVLLDAVRVSSLSSGDIQKITADIGVAQLLVVQAIAMQSVITPMAK